MSNAMGAGTCVTSRHVARAAALALVCHACASPASRPPTIDPTESRSIRTGPPTVEELKNATFTGIDERLGPVTLQNGRWVGARQTSGAASVPTIQLADDLRMAGDLDGDGVEEAVVILTYSPGGSGTFAFLAVVARRSGALRNVATTALGDRVQIRSIRVDGGRLVVSAVRTGATDPACCPGELVDWQWTLGDGRLNAVGGETTGRFSLATLAGTVWVLRAWDIGEPAGPEPLVSLAYDAGRFTGTSGCNRYAAGVAAGELLGAVSVGPAAGTRMACPEPQAAVEARFLRQLSGAHTVGFRMGRLAVAYTGADGAQGTMLFDATPESGSRARAVPTPP